MIGTWVLENPGETATAATVVATGAGWLLVKWLGDKFEPKRPVKTDEQKRLDLEEKARAVLSTQQIGVFADATITRVYHSAEFCENVERVVIRSKAIDDLFREKASHVFKSQESALRIIISEATKSVGDQLQKQLSDSQALFMSEFRAMRTEMSESIKAVADRVTALDTDLQVHEAEDRAKK